MCTHRVTKCHCHRKLGKLQMTSNIFIADSTNWVAFRQRAAHSEPEDSFWGTGLTRERSKVRLHQQPTYLPWNVFSVPLARFRVIGPYSEAILWISLAAKHNLSSLIHFFH